MAEEAVAPTPKTEKISFPAKLIGNISSVKEKISKLPIYAVDSEGSKVTAARVESRNIKKMPYLFYIITIEPEQMSAVYSIPPDTSESMRRAFILKNIASLASLIHEEYSIDEGVLLQYVDSTLDKMLENLSQSYSVLFNKYDSLLSEYRALKRLNIELAASNRNLTVQSSQLAEENKRIGEQLKKLQTYSDEALMSMVQDWIEVHNDTIEVPEFAKTYSLSPPRVEEILDKMVSLGYLEMRS